MTGAYTFKRFTPGQGQDHWDTPKGHWCGFMGGEFVGGKTVNRGIRVVLCCPECGGQASLPHQIDAQGGVHPSVVCPYEKENGCKFHTMPTTLEGWDYVERPSLK